MKASATTEAALVHQKQYRNVGGYSSGPRQSNCEVQVIAGHGVTPSKEPHWGKRGQARSQVLRH
jgi:hypothetical protein